MPLFYYFHKTLRVFKTGSPSVRFYYLLTVCCGSCISGGVVARHDIGKFTGSGGVVRSSLVQPSAHSLDTFVSYFAAVVTIACNCDGSYYRTRPLMPGSGDVYHVGQLENVTGTCRCSLFSTEGTTLSNDMKQGEKSDRQL